MEVILGTSPIDPDTDDDGLSDNEADEHGTDPLQRDSDFDGEIDGFEFGKIINLSDGSPGSLGFDGDSTGTAISSDGRYVVFAS